MKIFIWVTIPLLIVLGVYFFLQQDESMPLMAEEPDELVIPLGLPPIKWPADNPYSKKKAELGRLLYFDKRLSSDGTISCATCHSVPRAYTDHRKLAQGILGRNGSRHTPTIINAAYQKILFWDGRAASLEEQSKGPIGNNHEMTLSTTPHEAHQQCRDRIKKIEGYRTLFKEVFDNDECTIDEIAKAIATFERTVISGNSPYDRYKAGDKSAMTAQQIDGYKVFIKSRCITCHGGPIFTFDQFFNIGVGMDATNPDLGRYNITHEEKDRGSFKTPTLREVAHTYPYMHDGSLRTLEEVIDYYDKGGIPNSNLNPLIHPLNLSKKDKKDLLAFLHALNGEGWQHFKEPKKFPE